MDITFRLRFNTQPGQSLWLAGSDPLPAELIPLQYVDPECWEATLPLTTDAATAPLNYSYVLREADGSQISDWGQNRQLVPANFDRRKLLVIDSWNQPGFYANAFYTAPFKKVLLVDNFHDGSAAPYAGAYPYLSHPIPSAHEEPDLVPGGGRPQPRRLGYHHAHFAQSRARRRLVFRLTRSARARLSPSPTNTACSISRKSAWSVLKMATTGFCVATRTSTGTR